MFFEKQAEHGVFDHGLTRTELTHFIDMYQKDFPYIRNWIANYYRYFVSLKAR